MPNPLRRRRSVFPRFLRGCCRISHLAALLLLFGPVFATTFAAEEPPALNPFSPADTEKRDDAVPGRLELSDGSVHRGLIYLTRDKRLKIYDDKLQRQRDIPLTAVNEIQCRVKREWMEKEWTFKETTSDEKIFTGKKYPAREYLHTITLRDGRTITGPLSAIIYVEPRYSPARPEKDSNKQEPERFLLNKRNKGKPGEELKSLVYVKRIVFGKEAEQEEKNDSDATKQERTKS